MRRLPVLILAVALSGCGNAALDSIVAGEVYPPQDAADPTDGIEPTCYRQCVQLRETVLSGCRTADYYCIKRAYGMARDCKMTCPRI